MSPAPERRNPADALRSRQRDPGTRGPGKPVPNALRIKPIKATFDIPPSLYRQVKVWSAEHDVTMVEITKRLFGELLTDEKLARRIREGGQDTP